MLPSALSVTLDRASGRSLSLQLADGIRDLLGVGTHRSGDRLPSSRALAGEIGVARGVVEKAYEQLIAEGWLDSRRGSGTFVTDLPAAPRSSSARLSPAPRPHAEPVADLRAGRPWTPTTATTAWRRAWRDVGTRPQPADYPSAAGEFDLRVTLAELLARTRGLAVSPHSIVVTSGTSHGLSLALRTIESTRTKTGNPTIAVEDPGYRATVATALDRRWSVSDIPVDGDGMRVDLLSDTTDSVDAVYVTPSHQYPLGGLMPVSRRRALTEFATERDAIIVEDDYDSEFRYDVAPLPTVRELAPDHVVYLGTTAKTLGAGIRLGWMIAPPPVVDDIVTRRAALGDYPSVPLQRALRSLIVDGEWDQAVRSARRRYRDRDRLVADALGRYGDLYGVGAGMHTTLVLDSRIAAKVVEDSAEAGIPVPRLSDHTRTSDVDGLVIGYGRIGDDALVRALSVITASLERQTTRSMSPPRS